MIGDRVSQGSEHKITGSAEARELRRLVGMCSHLSALASQQTELGEVADFLARSTGSGVAVLDRGLETLAVAGGIDSDDVVGALRSQVGTSELHRVLAAAGRNRRALTAPRTASNGGAVVVAPVSVGDDVAGYLVTVRHGQEALTEDMQLLASEHAAMVCGILLGREVIVAAASGRARRELLEGLLLARGADDGEASRWAHHLGFDDSVEHTVMAASLPVSAGAADVSSVEGLLSRHVPEAIVSGRTDEVVAVVPAGAAGDSAVKRARELAVAWVASMRARNVCFGTIGIGNPCRSAAEIARSYTEARRALVTGARIGGPDPITLFAELGIHRLLARFPDVSELNSFAEEVVGPLIEEDRTTGMGYITTLSVYLEESNSPTRAGKRLFVHPNTISYRVRRIEAMTGLSLHLPQDRLMAEVAVKILDGRLGQR